MTDSARGYLEDAGVRLVDDGEHGSVDAVFVAHPKDVDFESLELAARAVISGARLLTGSYVAAYAGANGPILSRGAMVTAAIAKASGRRPTIVGKPSRAAVNEIERRLGVPTEEIAVIGDDLLLDVALGHLGGSRTVLVRSGISGSIDLDRVPERRRPHLTVEGVPTCSTSSTVSGRVSARAPRRARARRLGALARPPGDEPVGTDEHGALGPVP